MDRDLDISYHKKQLQIFDNPARFKVACCGRRFGKTIGSMNWMFEKAIEDNRLEKSWWIEPIYAQTKMVFKQFKNTFNPAIRYKNESDLIIELLNGSILEFKSSDNPDNLRGDKPKRPVGS